MIITGIYKADVGVKDGIIAGIGKAGNPHVMRGVGGRVGEIEKEKGGRMIVGVRTDVVAGEGLVLTAGGIDAHVHFICPQLIEVCLFFFPFFPPFSLSYFPYPSRRP